VEIWAARPDLVVVSPCSFGVERTERELSDPMLAAAVSEGSAPLGTFVADEAYFSRPGPRLADGVELLRHFISGNSWKPPMPVKSLGDLEVIA
jgi:iron complex transport system substrate-binding protein